MLKVILIIEIILIFLKFILGKYIDNCIKMFDLSIINSKTNFIYGCINLLTYIIGTVALIMLVINFIK